MGDEVLQQVAKRLTKWIRPDDGVGRYGGEEFMIVTSNCTVAEALKVADRALYRAKELGRNRVEWFSSESGGEA